MKKTKISLIAVLTFVLGTVTLQTYAADGTHEDKKSQEKSKNTENPDSTFVVPDVNLKELDIAPRFENFIYQRRLDSIQCSIQLDYNNFVQAYIDLYAFRKRQQVERMLGLSEYYYPMIEKVFTEQNIPTEFKHLAVVESALNPYAVSRVGATGMWQFMFTTGKMYGLKVNSHIDERKDPYKATVAASKYFKDMYARYGDWLLVIAAYNCGPGNVNRAIRKSGGKKDFWSIRPYLPEETRGYVPAYIAATYIMNFSEDHNLYPSYPNFSFENDTVQFNNPVSFKDMEALCGVTVDELRLLNPSYKKDFIPAYGNETFSVMVPATKKHVFLQSRDTLYRSFPMEMQGDAVLAVNTDPFLKGTFTRTHTVKKGETISRIAAKYQVSVADVRKWNNLKKNTVWAGQKLKIKRETESAPVMAKNPAKPKDTQLAAAATKSSGETERVKVNKEVTKTHVVKSGENLSLIAKKYDVGVEDLKKWNKLSSSKLMASQKLKVIRTEEVWVTKTVPAKEKERIENVTELASNDKKEKTPAAKTGNDEVEIVKVPVTVTYAVRSGDNLSSIAGRNGVSVQDLKEWNSLKSTKLLAGQKLKIRTTEEKVVVKNAPAQTEEAVAVKTSKVPVRSVSDDKQFVYYKVEAGDTLWSIAKRYEGMTVEKLKEMNNLKSDETLKAGMVLKVDKKG